MSCLKEKYETKNNNIIRFYMFANRLKTVIRKGWIEIEISKDRIESVAEHVYGTLILAIGINNEYNLNLDMYKVLKMLALHETEEILMTDYTIRDSITKDEKIEKGVLCVSKIVKGLCEEEELKKLLFEFSTRGSKEALFAHLVDKIECDFQAKMYDFEGVMDYNKAKEDLAYYGSRADEIDSNSKTASDFWIEYDRPRYDNDNIFKTLIEDIKNINFEEYKEIMNMDV